MRRSWKAFAVLFACASSLIVTDHARAYHGTSLSGSTGVWAPMLPDAQIGAVNYDQEDIGIIVGVIGRHRFEGYRTSIEGEVNYGETGDISMLNYNVRLRDTWQFGSTGLSAGLGYSFINFDQEFGPGPVPSSIDSDLQGAQIVFGWEGYLNNRISWLDLTIGLYDLDGTYYGAVAPTGINVSEFTTSIGMEFRTQTSVWGIPVSPAIGFQYFTDLPEFNNGVLGTSDAVLLNGRLEFLLW